MNFKRINGFKQFHYTKGFTIPETAYLVTNINIDYINIVVVKCDPRDRDKWTVVHLETGLETGIYKPDHVPIHEFKVNNRRDAVEGVIRKIESMGKEIVLKALRRYEQEDAHLNTKETL